MKLKEFLGKTFGSILGFVIGMYVLSIIPFVIYFQFVVPDGEQNFTNRVKWFLKAVVWPFFI